MPMVVEWKFCVDRLCAMHGPSLRVYMPWHMSKLYVDAVMRGPLYVGSTIRKCLIEWWPSVPFGTPRHPFTCPFYYTSLSTALEVLGMHAFYHCYVVFARWTICPCIQRMCPLDLNSGEHIHQLVEMAQSTSQTTLKCFHMCLQSYACGMLM